jgi:transcriptional regulator with XRE-family HTH domain
MKSRKGQSSQHRKRLGQAIRARRIERGLSQEKLAGVVECHRNYVGMVERGEQNLTIDMLTRFARALKTSVAEFAKQSRL